ncbi:hypothetical protein [Streptomyces alboflavus]|uniref:hypothetical protein n=1 Tax=Streptomyces alboflavus TaxID=67267 RepID=UPI0036B2979D
MASKTTDPEAEPPKPWEQQPGEGDKAYAALCAYYEQGVRRSYRRVGEELGKSRALVERWGAAHDWVERVRAWTARDVELERAEFAEERRAAARADGEVLAALVGKVRSALAELDPADLTPDQLTRMTDIVLKHRRALYGPVDQAPVTVTGTVGNMPVAVEVERFDRLPGPAQAVELEELAARVLRVRQALAA